MASAPSFPYCFGITLHWGESPALRVTLHWEESPALRVKKNMFLNVIAPWKCLLISIIYLSYILRLWIAIVKPWVARAIPEFYLVQVFVESWNFDEIFENFQKSRKFSRFEKKKRDLLYESSRRKSRLTVYRRFLHNTKTLGKRKSRRPRTQRLLTMKNIFLNVIASWKCLLISIIPLEKILKFI